MEGLASAQNTRVVESTASTSLEVASANGLAGVYDIAPLPSNALPAAETAHDPGGGDLDFQRSALLAAATGRGNLIDMYV